MMKLGTSKKPIKLTRKNILKYIIAVQKVFEEQSSPYPKLLLHFNPDTGELLKVKKVFTK